MHLHGTFVVFIIFAFTEMVVTGDSGFNLIICFLCADIIYVIYIPYYKCMKDKLYATDFITLCALAVTINGCNPICLSCSPQKMNVGLANSLIRLIARV